MLRSRCSRCHTRHNQSLSPMIKITLSSRLVFYITVVAAVFLPLIDCRTVETKDDVDLIQLMSDTEPNLSRLVQVQLVFRHGDRSPISTYPNDPHQAKDWPQGFGQLTQRGIKDAVAFGHYLRHRYKTFVSQEYMNKEVHVRSSDTDRTLMTAESVLAGFFTPTPALPGSNISIVTVPIHTQPFDRDQLFSLVSCPRSYELLSEWRATSVDFQTYVSQNQAMFQRLSKYAGVNVTENSVGAIMDAVFCEVQHNLSQPEWMEKEYQQLMSDFNLTAAFVAPTKDLQRLSSGTLLHRLLQNMEEKIAETADKPKLFLFSAHDATVMPLLRSLSVALDSWAAYLACVMLELYEIGRVYYVRALYRNRGHISILKVYDCDLMCHEAQFQKVLDPLVLKEEEREESCKSISALEYGSMKISQNIVPISVAAALVFLMVMFGCCYLIASGRLVRCLKCKKNGQTSEAQYRKLNQEVQDLLDEEEEDEF